MAGHRGETMEQQPRVAESVLAMLASLEKITDNFAVDQLVHSLQTATRAEEAGASQEVIVASLCHDIGKAISVINHPRIAAEILRPYVSHDTFQMILTHQDFQGRHYYDSSASTPMPAISTRAPAGTAWPSSLPMTGTRSASTLTTRPSRPRTSSRWCEKSSGHSRRFDRRRHRRRQRARPHRSGNGPPGHRRVAPEVRRPLSRPEARPRRGADLRLRRGAQHRGRPGRHAQVGTIWTCPPWSSWTGLGPHR